MTHPIVEAVARAIFDTLEGPVNNQDAARQMQQWNLSCLASIAAIRALAKCEPTEHMINEGADASFSGLNNIVVALIYSAMLDALVREIDTPDERKPG